MVSKIDAISEAKRYNVLATHILTTTYPVVKEPKVLLSALENVFLSISQSIDAIVYHAREKRLIPPFHNSFSIKFDLFCELAKRYPISKNIINAIEQLKELLMFSDDSPVEFSRNGDYILCSDDYDIKRITHELVYEMISHSRLLQKLAEEILHGDV